MLTSNDMQKVLDIQDKNLLFEEDCVSYALFKNHYCKFIYCTLSYMPTACKHCGEPNQNYSIYKNGSQTSSVTFPTTGVTPTYLNVKKQRFKCKNCQRTFTASTPIVQENCFISNFIKAAVLVNASEARSVKNIALETHVSATTVQRL
ncbi:transposase family protein, partial [Marinilactibacillus kalidii]|uniref:transposase family protein n=1 Tax=Marinilactibacillus kalidii TaxID=2820274 RepID=UPI001ABE4F33